MKFLSFIFFMLCISACSHNKSNYFIPKDFRYPNDSIGNGKLFMFLNSANKTREFRSFKNVIIGSQKYLIVTQFDSSSTSDSLLILNGKIVEEFIFFTPTDNGGHLSKFITVEDTIIEDGSILGKNIIKREFHDLVTVSKISIEEKFLKDTSIMWQNKLRMCIVTALNSKIEIYKPDHISESIVSVSGKLYYAKELGLIRWSVEFTDHRGNKVHTTSYLKEIYNSDK